MKSKVFLDSGGHSLHALRGKTLPVDFCETDAFWDYVEKYCEYIDKNKELLETYVTVDIVNDPELCWKVQRYMECIWNLSPMPVYHGGEDWKWLIKYLDNYEYIGVTGLARGYTKSQWIRDMGDPLFSLICKKPNYLPTHKIHGFAMTSPSLITAYPWYSVDSTSWIQFGKYGAVIIPRKINGKYSYCKSPYITFVTSRDAKKCSQGHFDNFVDIHQTYFYEYFKEKGFIVGSSEFKTVDANYKLQTNEHWADKRCGLVEIVIEEGLCNSHELRDKLNIIFYLDMEAQLPSWPWPWIKKVKATKLF